MKLRHKKIQELYLLLLRETNHNFELSTALVRLLLPKENEPLLTKVEETLKSNRDNFLLYLSQINTVDDFIYYFYEKNEKNELNELIFSLIKSETIKNFLINKNSFRIINDNEHQDLFSKKVFTRLDSLTISGDVFTKSQKILEEVSYQRSFIFLRKHFISLFQDQLNHQNLTSWISTFSLLKSHRIQEIKEFLKENHPNPFKDLIICHKDKVDIDNLLSFIYTFWPLTSVAKEEFFSYTVKSLSDYLKKLNKNQTINFLCKINQVDINYTFNNPKTILKNPISLNYESLYFHKIFLNISEKEQIKCLSAIENFINYYVFKSLPLLLKHKTLNTWKDYSQALILCQKADLLTEKALKSSFSFKLRDENFWKSFEEILDFQPFNKLKDLSENMLNLFPFLISLHITKGQRTWGSTWFNFYTKVALSPQSMPFQEFINYFKSLSHPVQSHKLIYYLSSVRIPTYNNFLLVFQILAYLNVANYSKDPFTLIRNAEEREWLLQISKKISKIDWINSSIIIHSLEKRPTLLEYLITKINTFSFSDLEYFDPYSPVLLWLLSVSSDKIENSVILHPQRRELINYLNLCHLWQDYNPIF